MASNNENETDLITAGILVIGDEILSGRTKDTNSGYIAEYLTSIGIDLKEIRVIGDELDEIVAAVRALSTRYTHVFTTGGIGPTHDDITADAMAAAFNVGIDHNDEAIAMMVEHYPPETELNDARLRMARIPIGASLIRNEASAPPGFTIGNVHVMAGVPFVMRAMLDEVGKSLKPGVVVHSETIAFMKGESVIAEGLGKVQARYDDVSIGSYPTMRNGQYMTNLVLRSRNLEHLSAAGEEVRLLSEELMGKHV